MAKLDRAGMIELLGRLGADNDETVLQAARELSHKLGESGLTWDELLRLDADAANAAHEPVEAGDAPAERELPADAESARLIDRLLARRAISDTLREDLTELKRAIANGSFDPTDASYIRALAKRLGV